jgi:hypothetical protein
MVQSHAEPSRDRFPPWSFSKTPLSVGFERVTGDAEVTESLPIRRPLVQQQTLLTNGSRVSSTSMPPR